jgi:hypothetical protein
MIRVILAALLLTGCAVEQPVQVTSPRENAIFAETPKHVSKPRPPEQRGPIKLHWVDPVNGCDYMRDTWSGTVFLRTSKNGLHGYCNDQKQGLSE